MEFIHGRPFPEFNWNRRTASGSPKVPLSLGYKDCCKKAIEEYMENNPVTLPVELDKRELITIQENELSKMQKDFRRYNTGHFNLCTFQLFANVAQAICSRFSQKKVTKEELITAIKCSYKKRDGGISEHDMDAIADAILDTLYPKEKK